SYRYDLPFFSKAEGWKHVALGGWAVSGITIFQSGAPFSVIDSSAGTALLGGGLASGTAGGSLAPGGSISAGLTSGDIHTRADNGYLNPANFVPAPLVDPVACGNDSNFCTSLFGDLGRN